MRKKEAEQYVGRKIKLILRNNFHYSGKILSVSEDTLSIMDKFNHHVSINLNDIMIFEEVENA